MAERIDETDGMTGNRNAHLAPAQVAAFVDRTAGDDARRVAESHLAVCAECRAEVADITRVVAETRRSRSRPVWMAAVAAAGLVAVVVWPRGVAESPSVHREAPVTATAGPTAVRPIGIADSVPALVWTAVPHAHRYHVRIFTTDGSVVWQGESTDTVAAIPPSPGWRAGQTYYWSVEAHVGFDRTVASELTPFSVRPR